MTLRLVGRLSLLLLGAGCRDGAFSVEREACDLLDLATPSGATTLRDSGVLREAMQISRTRQIDTTLSWTEYSAWLSRQHLPGYDTAWSSRDGVAFRRLLPGDRFELTIARAREGPPLDLTLSFVARPD